MLGYISAFAGMGLAVRCYQLALMKRNIFESASSSLDIPGRPLTRSWRPCRPWRPRHLDGRVLGPRILPLQHRVRLSHSTQNQGLENGHGKADARRACSIRQRAILAEKKDQLLRMREREASLASANGAHEEHH